MGLDDYRKKLDEIDADLLELLAKRMSLIETLAEYKKYNKLPIMDMKRESQVLKKLSEMAKKKKLNPEFVEKIFVQILDESKRIQRDIF